MKLSNFSEIIDSKLYQKVASSTFVLYQPQIITFNYYQSIHNNHKKEDRSFHYAKSKKEIQKNQEQERLSSYYKPGSSIGNKKVKISLVDNSKSNVKHFNKTINFIHHKKSKKQGNMFMTIQSKHINAHKLSITLKSSSKMEKSNLFTSKSSINKQYIDSGKRSHSFITNFSMDFCGCDDFIKEDQHDYFQQIKPKMIQSQYLYVEKNEGFLHIEKQAEPRMFKKCLKNKEVPSNLNEASKSRQKIFQIKLNKSLNKSLDQKNRQKSRDRKGIFSEYKSNSKSASLDHSKSHKNRIFSYKIPRIKPKETNINHSLDLKVKTIEQKINEVQIPSQILEQWKKLPQIDEELISFRDSAFQSKEIL